MGTRNLFHSRFRFLLVALALVAAAVWSGYRAERKATDAAGAPETSVKRMVKRLVTPAAERAGTDRLEELRQTIGRKTPSRREVAALWSVVRGFSAGEVAAALDSLPKETGIQVNHEIEGMLYHRWAQLDPEAAAAAALEGGEESSFTRIGAVLNAWSQSDPDAAIRWGRESGSHSARNLVSQIAARKWVVDDPATAITRARAEFPEALRSIHHLLMARLLDKPESRLEALALLGQEMPEQDREGHILSLAYQAGPLDPAKIDEIAADMAAAGWSEDSVVKLRETFQSFVLTDDPPPVLERADREMRRDDREAAYRSWVSRRPEEALKWAETRGESVLISQSVGTTADEILASAWTPGREYRGRGLDTLRKQFAVWQRLEAPAAAAWLASMPADLRSQITTAATRNNATR